MEELNALEYQNCHDLPKNLADFHDALLSQGVEIDLYDNFESTEAGCDVASLVRRGLNNEVNEKTRQLNEVRTSMMTFKVKESKNDERVQVCFHTRGNRHHSKKKIKAFIKEQLPELKLKNFRETNTEELQGLTPWKDSKVELGYGKMNPFIINENVYHVFDEDLFLSYAREKSCTTNFFDGQIGCSFQPASIFDALSAAYPGKYFRGQVTAAPSKVLRQIDAAVNTKLGMVVYGEETEALFKDIFAGLWKTTLESTTEINNENPEDKVSIGYDGTFDDISKVAISDSRLGEAMSNLNPERINKRLVKIMNETIEQVLNVTEKDREKPVVVIPCNLLSKLVPRIKTELLNKVELVDMYASVKEQVESKMTDEKENRVLLLAGSEVSQPDSWYQQNINNVEFQIPEFSDDQVGMNKLLHLVDQGKIIAANKHVFDLLKQSAELPSSIMIAATSLSVLYNKNGEQVLDPSCFDKEDWDFVNQVNDLPVFDTLKIHAEATHRAFLSRYKNSA